MHDEQHALRDHLTVAYRRLRAGDAVALALPHSPVVAGRVLAVLAELGLAEIRTDPLAVTVPSFAGRAVLEQAPTFAACAARHREGDRWLRPARPQAA